MAGDPLDALRLPVVPVDPRPEFAATLRRQWSASLWRATPTSQATVISGASGCRAVATAARKVSATKSSAMLTFPQRGRR